MTRKYILSCAGYDRPGGKISREVITILSGEENVVIGSVAALFAERPGEMKDFRASQVICINGCSTNCASELATAKGVSDISELSIPDYISSDQSDHEKAITVAEVVQSLYQREAVPRQQAQVNSSEEDYLLKRIDKFILKVKKDLYYSDNDFWIKIEGDLIRVGVSDYLQQVISDIYSIELEELGSEVTLADDIGVIESTKTAMEIIAPISGTILKRNEQLYEKPELINESPYDEGWLFVIEPLELTDEIQLLKDAMQYLNYAYEKAIHELGKKVIQ